MKKSALQVKLLQITECITSKLTLDLKQMNVPVPFLFYVAESKDSESIFRVLKGCARST